MEKETNQMNSNKRNLFLLHPFLFALYPLVFLLSKNITEVEIGQAVVPGIILVLVGAIVFFISWLVLGRNIYKAAIFATFSIILLFAGETIFNLIDKNTRIFAVIKKRYLYLIFLLLFLLVFYLLRKSKSDLLKLNRILYFVSIVLIIFNVVSLAFGKITREKIAVTKSTEENNIELNDSIKSRPDIYCFILDEYARQDILKRIHGLDNSRFIDELRQRGFFVADSSHSNYPYTEVSLSSLLNFEYNNKGLNQELLSDNRVFAELKKMGYTIYSSSFMVPKFKNSDYSMSYLLLPGSLGVNLINMTPLKSLITLDIWRKEILYLFSESQKMGFKESPKFVFIHVPCPHAPFIFGPDGESVDPKHSAFNFHGQSFFSMGGTHAEYSEGYRNQVIYLNKIMIATVDSIIKHSKQPPVIIIMGDHGSRLLSDFTNFDNNYCTEQFSNLTAIKFPDGNDSTLYQTITPVNIFRITFNKYFNAHLPIIPDSSFYDLISSKVDFKYVGNKLKQEAEEEKEKPYPTQWLDEIGTAKY